MRIQVKLFGTLSIRSSDYRSDKGLTLEFPDGALVNDLLARLEIPIDQGLLVCMNNKILRKEDSLINNASIVLLQAIGGG